MSRIQVIAKNVNWQRWESSAAMGVLGSDGSPQHFDRRWPSWILRKMKNSFAGLFQGSISMSMPNFDWIRWTGSKCQAKMWIFPPQHHPQHPQQHDQQHDQPPPLCEKAVHRASHFPVGAKNTSSTLKPIKKTDHQHPTHPAPTILKQSLRKFVRFSRF